jgi:hypothetical protein
MTRAAPIASAIRTTTAAWLFALRVHAVSSVSVGDSMSRGYAAAHADRIAHNHDRPWSDRVT